MKKILITMVSIVLMVALLVGVGSSGFTNWDIKSWFHDNEKGQTINKEGLEDIEFMPNSTSDICLELTSPIYLANTENGYTKLVTITATVLPEDVPDKSVDWHIEWADESVSLTLSEYLTITPTSNGSLSATVTCYKPFDNDVIITVVTRVGGMSATCLVTYVGVPESMIITTNSLSATTHSTIGTYYALSTGGSYTFNLACKNGFNDVRASTNYTYTVSAQGNIITQDRKVNVSTNNSSYIDGTQETLAIKDITKINNYVDNSFECNISGSTLTIMSNSTLSNYYSSSVRTNQTITYYDSFKSYEDDNWYYYITVTETNSGVSQTLKFRPVSSVSSVSIAPNTIGI